MEEVSTCTCFFHWQQSQYACVAFKFNRGRMNTENFHGNYCMTATNSRDLFSPLLYSNASWKTNFIAFLFLVKYIGSGTLILKFWNDYGEKYKLFSLNFAWKENYMPILKGNNSCKMYNFLISRKCANEWSIVDLWIIKIKC